MAVLSLAGPWSAWLTPILLAAWVLAASVVLILNALSGKEEAALNPQPLPPQPER